MKQFRQRENGDMAVVEAGYQRQDLHRRDIVDHAILVQASTNTVSAIEYLKSHDIPSAVIERVLLEPNRRRNHIPH